MEFVEINTPSKPENGNIIFGTITPPSEKLSSMSDKEFERIVEEWAHGYLKEKYIDVRKIGGAGDKGRDVICYYKNGDIDIYQCKHYHSSIKPSNFWVEFGKLCYYTLKNEYKIPITYYVVANAGIGKSFNDLLEDTSKINDGLIKNWDTYCKKKITDTIEIELDNELKDYIKNFDFSIVKNFSILTLLEQYETTPWFKYRFGGGLIKRPKPEVPSKNLTEEEKKLEYINELIKVYAEYSKGKINSLEVLEKSNMLNEHFSRQRISYYSSQTLKRFSRDELLDEKIYDDIKDEIYCSVVDTSLQEYDNGFTRLKETLSEARKIVLATDELGNIHPNDKCGICHELVNDKKLRWVDIENEY